MRVRSVAIVFSGPLSRPGGRFSGQYDSLGCHGWPSYTAACVGRRPHFRHRRKSSRPGEPTFPTRGAFEFTRRAGRSGVPAPVDNRNRRILGRRTCVCTTRHEDVGHFGSWLPYGNGTLGVVSFQVCHREGVEACNQIFGCCSGRPTYVTMQSRLTTSPRQVDPAHKCTRSWELGSRWF